MDVRLIACTTMIHEQVDELIEWPQNGTHYHAEMLAEFAGRNCYQSWSRSNPATSTTQGYIGNIIDQRHFSVLEHASATFYIAGVSRTLTHELVRHRHLSFSQRSQRYVDEVSAPFVMPEVLQSDSDVADPDIQQLARRVLGHHKAGQALYGQILGLLRGRGLDRKTARGAARSVLAGNVATQIVVSGNHRAWRDFIERRHSVAADPEIRQLASRILSELRMVAPAIYQDFPEDFHEMDVSVAEQAPRPPRGEGIREAEPTDERVVRGDVPGGKRPEMPHPPVG